MHNVSFSRVGVNFDLGLSENTKVQFFKKYIIKKKKKL